jgi:hypothetical protein
VLDDGHESSQWNIHMSTHYFQICLDIKKNWRQPFKEIVAFPRVTTSYSFIVYGQVDIHKSFGSTRVLESFVNDWNAHGPAHHCAIGVSHLTDQLRKLAALLGMELAQVC